MIIWLASFPRSGNTFFRLLFHHLYQDYTYSVYNDPLLEEMGASEILGQKTLDCSIEECRQSDKTYLLKTHDLPTDDSPVVYLVRDGRDALVSYTHYQMKFTHGKGAKARLKEFLGKNTFESILRHTICKTTGSENWSNHVLTWLRDKPNPNTVMIRYEDLVAGPIETMQKAVGPFGFRAGDSTSLPTFDELNRKWPNFFRKGKSGSWKTEMPEEHQTLFHQHHGEAMQFLGYRSNS